MSAVNSSCEQVDELMWKATTYRVGQLVSFDETIHDARKCSQDKERREGTVIELWIEAWRDTTLAYAEVDVNGREMRAWFHRDHVGAAGELGAAPEDALF